VGTVFAAHYGGVGTNQFDLAGRANQVGLDGTNGLTAATNAVSAAVNTGKLWPTNVISLPAAAGTNALSISGNNANFLQLNLQNANSAGASDYVLTEDTGTPFTGFLDVYQNNSAYSASSMKTIDSSNDVGVINVNTNPTSRLWIQSNVTNGTVNVATTGTGGSWNTNEVFYPGSGKGTGSNVIQGTLFGNINPSGVTNANGFWAAAPSAWWSATNQVTGTFTNIAVDPTISQRYFWYITNVTALWITNFSTTSPDLEVAVKGTNILNVLTNATLQAGVFGNVFTNGVSGNSTNLTTLYTFKPDPFTGIITINSTIIRVQ
jgi:hypothetical protein